MMTTLPAGNEASSAKTRDSLKRNTEATRLFIRNLNGTVFWPRMYKGPAKAFSLLELVISVAILVSGITVVMQALSYSAFVAGVSADTIKAAHLAQDLLQELEFKEKNGLLEDTPVDDAGSVGKFQWKYTLDFRDALRLYELNLGVSWERKRRKDTISFNTYLR